MKKVVLKIDGLSSSINAMKLERQLNKYSKIKSAAVSWKRKNVTILYQDSLSIEELEEKIQEAGYTSVGIDIINSYDHSSPTLLNIFAVTIGITFYFILANTLNWPLGNIFQGNKKEIALCVIGTIFLLYSIDIILDGWKHLFQGKSNRYSLLSISVSIAYLYSLWNEIHYFQTGEEPVTFLKEIMVILLIAKIGKYMENQTKEELATEIKQIAKTTMGKVNIKENDLLKEINIADIKENDKIVCLPGDRILVDGIITDGCSHVDESQITGQSQPIEKRKNAKVLAGSINCENELEYQKDFSKKESTTSEIIKLVAEEKNNQKEKIGIVDIVSRILIPFILIGCILLTFLCYWWIGSNEIVITRIIRILLVSYPIGFLIASPITMKCIMKYQKKGFLIKQSEILEYFRRIDTVILDKTGTITNGYLSISRINNHSEMSDRELLELLGSIEKHSTHALARGITKYLRNEKIKTSEDFITEDLSGYGVKAKDEGNIYYACNSELLKKLDIINSYSEEERKMKMEGNSVIYLTKNNKVIATFGLKDILRRESKKFIHSLKEKNLLVYLVTGDNEITTNTIAKDLEFDKVIAGVDSKQKSEIVKQLQKEGKRVMYIGDGLNDAPALATANIGVALKNTLDVPPSAANVVLMGNNLTKVLEIFQLSKRISHTLRRNILSSMIISGILIVICLGIIPKLTLHSYMVIIGMIVNFGVIILNTILLKKKELKK